ncbi:hypothetical protein [Pseudoalteromonas distincta]|uniref:hypothetical protein n=1 Tax=Pseudoalteromonas distincta TaxID=77608 RepID=UPI00241DF057|nr:hypothetical protein [Pseudoalteromonas distincta]|tara:strand:+ start:16363 stop:16686 length:324 start_codon:yes stop_codon:yes gene_type:complete
MKGAGGSSGGIGHFFIGLIMMCGGFYMLLNAISVTSNFGLSSRIYSVNALGGFGVTGGMVMIPFIFGVISSVRFSMRTMTSFDLIVIIILAFGGLGLFLRSLKSIDT